MAGAGVSIPVMPTSPSPARAAPAPSSPPHLRLPVRPARRGPFAVLAVVAHVAVLGAVVFAGARLGRRAGPAAAAAAAESPVVNFFVTRPAAPVAVAVPPVAALPPAPRIDATALAAVPAPRVEVPPLFQPELRPSPGTSSGALAPAGGGGGGGGGQGGSEGDAGTGTEGGGGYIFVASPRTAILPPLARVPGSVAGRTYRVTFWVSAAGRVTRVVVDPPIADAEYGREFQQRMMAYQFYPARTRDGRTVASVVTVPLRIGH
jgi:hypothetical protein